MKNTCYGNIIMSKKAILQWQFKPTRQTCKTAGLEGTSVLLSSWQLTRGGHPAKECANQICVVSASRVVAVTVPIILLKLLFFVVPVPPDEQHEHWFLLVVSSFWLYKYTSIAKWPILWLGARYQGHSLQGGQTDGQLKPNKSVERSDFSVIMCKSVPGLCRE